MAARVESQLSFTWGSLSPALVSSHLKIDLQLRHGALDKTQVGAVSPRRPQGQHTQWIAIDHLGASPPCPCTADPPQRAEVDGQWLQPLLAADWLG